MSEEDLILFSKIKTWEDSSNGIFYYKYKSDNHIYTINISIKSNEYLYRINEIDIYSGRIISSYKIKNNLNNDNEKDFNILFRFRKSLKKNNIYEIINSLIKINKVNKDEDYINSLNDKIWYPVKSFKSDNSYYEENSEDYILNENDIIKLGRLKYEVIKLNLNYPSDKNILDNDNNYNISEINRKAGSIFIHDIKHKQYKIEIKKNNENSDKNSIKNSNVLDNINQSTKISTINEEKEFEEKINEDENCEKDEKCRICYNLDSSEEDPKIRLCKCHDYIHFKCLKKYLSYKMIVTHNLKETVTTYTFSKFNCDICKTPYPIRFRIPDFDKIYNLVDLNLPQETNYFVLESLDYIKEENNIKTIHVVQLYDDYITLGRANTNDIQNNDISFSREHAIIKFDKLNGNLILENKSEKFGTLVLVRGNIKMKEKNINLQIGKSYITLNLISKEGLDQLNNAFIDENLKKKHFNDTTQYSN